MRFPLRTLLVEPLLRFRLSLLSFLLGSTLVGVMIAHWFSAREVDRLRMEVTGLRAENKAYRDQLGILTITDPALPHAIYVTEFRTLNTWSWKFYTPKGRQFRLCLAYDGIAAGGVLPAADTRFVVLADNLPVEGTVTCSIHKGGMNDPNAGIVIVHLDRSTKRFEIPHDSSAWVRPNLQCEKEICGEKATIHAAAGQPLVLFRLRGYRVAEVVLNGAKAHPRLPPDNSPGPGVLLWIEEQPSSLAAAR